MTIYWKVIEAEVLVGSGLILSCVPFLPFSFLFYYELSPVPVCSAVTAKQKPCMRHAISRAESASSSFATSQTLTINTAISFTWLVNLSRDESATQVH
jgi:hypothetical protein